VREAARVLLGPEPAGLLLGGGALLEQGIVAAGQLAAGAGVRVFANRFSARMACGGGRFAPQRLAYFPEPAEAMLAGLKHIILVESVPPVSFFGYPGRRSYLAPEDCEFHMLGADGGQRDGGAGGAGGGMRRGRLLAAGAGDSAARAAYGRQPNAGYDWPGLGQSAAGGVRSSPTKWSLPAKPFCGTFLGVELRSSADHGRGHRPRPAAGSGSRAGVPGSQGDRGSKPTAAGMYTLQSLWTMARERLDVVSVILANRRYRILDIEMQRTGAGAMGPMANDMVDISRPDLDWVKMSEGMGVAATRATTADEFVAHSGRR